MKRAILILLFAATPAVADDAPTHTLRVVNDTSAAVNQLFVSGGKSGGLKAKVSGIFGAADDERDRLDAKMLPRGGSIVITLKGERCRYDVRAVLEDGRSYADQVDVCASSGWAISQGNRR